jgi:hypothetical protein
MNTKSFRLFAGGAALAMLAVLPACVPHPPGGSPPPTGQQVCESYGGTFVVGTGDVLWECTNLATLPGGMQYAERFDALADACGADDGEGFGQRDVPPQDAACGA